MTGQKDSYLLVMYGLLYNKFWYSLTFYFLTTLLFICASTNELFSTNIKQRSGCLGSTVAVMKKSSKLLPVYASSLLLLLKRKDKMILLFSQPGEITYTLCILGVLSC